jgi:YbbR domain-containing protein
LEEAGMSGKSKLLMRNDMFAKILSIVAAIALWLYVMYEQNPVVSRTYILELEKRGLPARIVLLHDLNNVRVKVNGPRQRVAEVSARDVVAFVDLSGLEKGVHDKKVQIRLPAGVQLEEVTPSLMVVSADLLASRNFPVNPSFNDYLPPEFAARITAVEPNVVRVYGPAQFMENISFVETSLNIDQGMAALGEYKVTAPLVLFDKNHDVYNKVAAEPSSVTLTLKVDARVISKELPIKAALTGSLPAGYNLINTEIVPGSVTLTGLYTNLQNINEVLTEEIALTSLTRDFSSLVRLLLPFGVTADKNHVHVGLTVKEDEGL